MKVRLRLVWTGLVLAGVALVAADAAVLALPQASGAQPAAASAACPRRQVSDPVEAARRVLLTAVERRNLAASYTLASPSLRGRRSCAEWAGGHVPFAQFRHIDWSRATYEPVASGEGQVVLRVLLYRVGAADPVAFMMEVQKETSEPGWHVGYFARDRDYRPPAAASARLSA